MITIDNTLFMVLLYMTLMSCFLQKPHNCLIKRSDSTLICLPAYFRVISVSISLLFKLTLTWYYLTDIKALDDSVRKPLCRGMCLYQNLNPFKTGRHVIC